GSSMVGDGRCGMPSHSCSRFSKRLILALQRMDGRWPYLGLDQYKNYFRVCLLPHRNSHWIDQTMPGERSYGPAAETRLGHLPCCRQAPTAVPFNKAVLVGNQSAVSSQQ